MSSSDCRLKRVNHLRMRAGHGNHEYVGGGKRQSLPLALRAEAVFGINALAETFAT